VSGPRWKLVPVDLDATDTPGGLGMLVAGKEALYCVAEDPEIEHARACWKAMLAVAPDGPDGQDRKFAFRNGQFVNRVSGEAIPLDEPVILFRARDNHALPVLREYLTMSTDPHHRQAIKDRMGEFAAWRAEHPDRVKEPGITHHIRLNDEPAALSQPWVPRIGDPVKVPASNDFFGDYEHTQLWVAGLSLDDRGRGIDVTVSEQWPVPSRHSRDYMGQTDGFLIARTDGVPDDLEPRGGLASVSSASAHKRQTVPVLCDFYLGDCRRCDRRADATNQQEPCARPNGRFAPSASPEPVPATNQAGEVDATEIASKLLACVETGTFYTKVHNRDELHGVFKSVLLAALATQPATSQEGARHPGWTAAGHKWLDAGCAPIAATSTPPTYTQAQREQAARVLRVGEPVALEPGKWEALVDAVAEALGMRKAGA